MKTGSADGHMTYEGFPLFEAVGRVTKVLGGFTYNRLRGLPEDPADLRRMANNLRTLAEQFDIDAERIAEQMRAEAEAQAKAPADAAVEGQPTVVETSAESAA